MNVNIPFLASTAGYALYLDGVHKGRFDLGATDSTVWSYFVDGGAMTYYLIIRPTVAGQLERYTWLTGRQPMPPRWAFGYLQSKNRYGNDSTARAIVRTIRSEGFPCDAIILDLAWFRNMGDLQWNHDAWPDPQAMTVDFLKQGIKTVLITEPYVVEPSSGFREGLAGGYLCKDSLGKPFLLDGWWSCRGCNAALVDMTNPAARKWWWSRHTSFLGKNVAGLWTDLGEPERHPPGMWHQAGPAMDLHNIYNFLWAQMVFEGMQDFRPGQRVFNLTRSGFAGIQRFGVLPWTGDVARSFDGLAGQIPLMLNMGMSGLAFLHSDIGGYARNPTTSELYVRWVEYGAFCPVMRAHGAGESVGGSPTEPWQFGAEAAAICREFIRLRYRLLPYTYTLAHENAESGIPLARPLFFGDPVDARAYVETTSYFWGDAFLVAPVLKAGTRSRDVYLPPGKWFDFWSDEVVEGGKTVYVAAPLDRIPVFVRSGSIVPMAPVMDWSNERPLDTLTLNVYPDAGNPSRYTLYEDDGTTQAYQRGRFSLTSFADSSFSQGTISGIVVTIGSSRGGFDGKLPRRTYVAVLHGIAQAPDRVMLGPLALTVRDDLNHLPGEGNGFFYQRSTHRLYVQANCSSDSTCVITIGNSQK
jgi:alpha-glucosidase (family GH31 glycosyl hydrolase)